MSTLLAIFTILGGIAALWYFWDKIVALTRPKSAASDDAPVIEGSPAQLTPPTPAEKWVDFAYPRDSGLQAKLEANGFQVAWCLDNRLARKTELEGWQVVVESGLEDRTFVFRLKDKPNNQTLIKKATRQ